MESEEKDKEKFFLTYPLKATEELRELLDITEIEYLSVVGHFCRDPKSYFLYACLDEVIKLSTACLRWNEFSDSDEEKRKEFNEMENSQDGMVQRIHRATISSVADEQQMWTRKLNEILSLLILFTTTNEKRYYMLYLSVENLSQYNKLQNDFNEYYGCKNLNAQSNINTTFENIKNNFSDDDLKNVWFLKPKKEINSNLRMKTVKEIFPLSIKLANSSQKIALGVSYESGYSTPSRSIHSSIGSVTKIPDMKSIQVMTERTGLFSISIIDAIYELLEIEPKGVGALLRDVVKKSDNDKFASRVTDSSIEIGDLVFAYGNDVCIVVDKKSTEFGYSSFHVRYLTPPLHPDIKEDWFPARYVRLIFSKIKLLEMVREVYAKHGFENVDMDRLGHEEYLKAIEKIIVEWHKSGILEQFMIKK